MKTGKLARGKSRWWTRQLTRRLSCLRGRLPRGTRVFWPLGMQQGLQIMAFSGWDVSRGDSSTETKEEEANGE